MFGKTCRTDTTFISHDSNMLTVIPIIPNVKQQVYDSPMSAAWGSNIFGWIGILNHSPDQLMTDNAMALIL